MVPAQSLVRLRNSHTEAVASNHCPLLIEGRLPQCSAVQPPEVPVVFVRERFCLGAGHTRCRAYSASNADRAAPLSPGEFTALWFA